MTERPMKQLSLRKFRDSITEIHSVVEVSKREPDGGIIVLGYWTPYVQYPDDSEPLLPWQPGDPAPTATISVLDGETGETVVKPQTLVIPIPDEPGPRLIQTPEEAAAAVPQVRPFSKADQAGRKKK